MRRTLHGLFVPSVIAAALAAIAWVIQDLPAHISVWVRVFNGFAIMAFLIRDHRRVLAYEDHLAAHRADILNVMRKGEETRQREVDELVQTTAKLAASLAREAALAAAAEAAVVLDKKLETIEGNAHHAMKAQAGEVIAAVERGTAAAHAAQQEANHTNKKIEELREDLNKKVAK